MIISKLLTRYILAPIWAKLLIFITFYFLILQLHFFENNFSYIDCMLSSSDAPSEAKTNRNEINDILSQQESLCKHPLIPPRAHIEEVGVNLARYKIYQQIYELQEQVKQKAEALGGAEFYSAYEKYNQIIKEYGEIYRFQNHFTTNVYFKTGKNPGGPIYQGIADQNQAAAHLFLDFKKQADRLLAYSFWDRLPFELESGEALNRWVALKTDPLKSYKFFQTIIRTTDHEFLKLVNKLRDIENSFTPLIAESKATTIKEIQESMEDLIDIRVNEAASRLVCHVDSRISAVEEIQHKNQQALINLEIKQQASQRDMITNLRNSFDRKLELANNEILNLKMQNQELQRSVMEQVAEAKNQQELINNVRKSFERKLNEKDSIIKDLHHSIALHDRLHTVQKREVDNLTNEMSHLQSNVDRIVQKRINEMLAQVNPSRPPVVFEPFPDVK